MPRLIPRREHFNEPQLLSPAWTLRKGAKTVECAVWTHVLGVELRAFVGDELLQTHVCKSQEEVIRVQDEWRAAFEAKGWKG